MEKKRLELTYDMEYCPLSYDVVMSLAIGRAVSLLNSLQPKFDLVIMNRSFREVGVEGQYGNDYKFRKFNDVVLEVIKQCKWINSFSVIRDDTKFQSINPVILPTKKACMTRGRVPEWQITPMVPRQLETIFTPGLKLNDGFVPSDESSELVKNRFDLSNAIVFYPRKSKFLTEKNANKEMFTQVGQILKKKGFKIFFVPDIEDLRHDYDWEDFDGVPIEMASYSLDIRLAVASAAKANLLWCGGTAAPFHFSSVKYITVANLNEESVTQKQSFFNNKGPKIGENPPWLNPESQIWDWTNITDLTADYVAGKVLGIAKV